MNIPQRILCAVALVLVLVSILAAPWQFRDHQMTAEPDWKTEYHPVWCPPDGFKDGCRVTLRVNAILLEWGAVGIVAGLGCLICRPAKQK